MTRFIDVFRELGSFSEVLQTQLELLLCERLQSTWVKVHQHSHAGTCPSPLSLLSLAACAGPYPSLPGRQAQGRPADGRV